MLNLGAGEVILILVVALLILGPKRLPELARGLGKFMREIRRQTDEVRSVVEREFYRMDQEVGSGLEGQESQPQSQAQLPPPSSPSSPSSSDPQPSILPVQAPRPPASLMAEASRPTNPGIKGPAASAPPPLGTVPAHGGRSGPNGSSEGT